MKLHELGAQRPTEHIAKTLHSHMGHKINFDRMTMEQARVMLARTQSLLSEWRGSVSRHYSERNPDYMKLIMVEQALKQRLGEQMPAATPGAAVAGAMQVDPRKQAALATAQQQQKKREIQDQIKQKQQEIQQLQKAMNMPTMMAEKYMGFDKTVAAIKKGGSARDPEAVAAAIGRKKYGKKAFQKAAAAGKKMGESRRMVREASEVNQAQVVLAAQDMVDQIQKMTEQISSMQFKDLPSLTDAIKNDMGVDQAGQFQSQAAAALSNLLTSVQQGKTELEAAQGVLTGQAPQVPGMDAGAAAPASTMPAAEPGTEVDADLSLDANLPPEGDEEEVVGAALGRERR